MRIWDISPRYLCKKHLLGEHRELHGLWNIITQNKSGYSKHPETLRWVGKAPALYIRHGLLVDEMTARGYNHKSEIAEVPDGLLYQEDYVHTVEEQKEILRKKGCECRV